MCWFVQLLSVKSVMWMGQHWVVEEGCRFKIHLSKTGPHSAFLSPRKPSSPIRLVSRLGATHFREAPLACAAKSLPPSPKFPLSRLSPYCPLTHFPQCYKLQTTQTSRPNAPLWTPSKLHFLENREAGFIDNTGHTVRPFIYWQGEKARDGPSNRPERHQRFLQSADETTFQRLRQWQTLISSGHVKHLNDEWRLLMLTLRFSAEAKEYITKSFRREVSHFGGNIWKILTLLFLFLRNWHQPAISI